MIKSSTIGKCSDCGKELPEGSSLYTDVALTRPVCKEYFYKGSTGRFRPRSKPWPWEVNPKGWS